uniref:Uncharacterized protein n=1 Tax=Arabidopsis thaliana TaxID=3702 RepID=Q56WS9_ARATH|nr:hypothetical protein [Arabidopsis thaliana]
MVPFAKPSPDDASEIKIIKTNWETEREREISKNR